MNITADLEQELRWGAKSPSPGVFEAQKSSCHIGLRNNLQKRKTTIICLKTMDYKAGLKSVENLTNSVMLLPKYIRHKFYRDFKIINSNDGEMNLEIIKSCLGERVSNMNNKYTKNKIQRFPKEHCRCRNKITRRFILISFTCSFKNK